jgi:FKBP12-rapamycin complex-associated protein
MRETFVEVGHHVMGLRLHKDPLVRRTVVILIPTLASFDKSLFVECFLHTAAPHLISILEKPQDRSSGSPMSPTDLWTER